MFSGCQSLKAINVSNFVTSNVSDMSFMLSGCKSLTSIDVSHFNTINVKKMVYIICKIIKYYKKKYFKK